MASLSLTFPDPLNVSLAIGDTAYYVATNTKGGFLTTQQSGNTNEETIVKIGVVSAINQTTNTITIATNTLQSNQLPTTSSYIFFSKDNKVNSSSILGYYAEVTFKNNSTTEAELYSIGCVAGESSK
tara:strand:- start:1384 stop:1764 length:381 start_codon:yes stop_codon:yes gene_type:complete